MSLIVRGAVVWLLLLLGAIVNGAVRQTWLVPRLGDPGGHVASTLMLSALIFGVGWILSGWLDLANTAEAWRLGFLWLGLTIAFEFLAGHFLFGAPWSRLLSDYNLAEGRIWLLVLVTTLLTPRVVLQLTR